MGVEYMDEIHTVEIKRGIAHLSWPSGGDRAIPLDIFRQNVARSVRALAEFDAKCAVVPFPRTGHG